MSAKAELSDSAALAILKLNGYLKNCPHWIESYVMHYADSPDRIKRMQNTLRAAEKNIAKMKAILQEEFQKSQL